jgi:Fe-S-cluster containining protein
MLEYLGTFLKEKLKLGVNARPGCHACGRCCEAFGAVLHASERDLERWKKLGREDLLVYAGETGWLWLDEESGQRLQRCPFLTRTSEQRSICGIHDIKPDICRAYPSETVGRQCVSGVYFPVSLWAPGRSKSH